MFKFFMIFLASATSLCAVEGLSTPALATSNSLVMLVPPTSNSLVLTPNYVQINTQNYQVIHTYITTKFKGVTTENAHLISFEICKQTEETKVDPFLMASIIAVESRFNHKAVGAGRASGLGQFMPGTARRFEIQDPFNITQNITGMGKYLGRLHKMWNKYDNEKTLVLVSYNRGERHVQLNRTTLGPKALSYPEKVFFHYKKLEDIKASLSGEPTSSTGNLVN